MRRMRQLAYYETQTFVETLGGRSVHFVSKPGLPHWTEVSPAQRLLAETVTSPSGAEILLVDTGPGTLAAALCMKARPARLSQIDINAIALELAPRTLAANDLDIEASFGATIAGEDYATFDVAVFEVPQNRKLARRRLLEIHAALREGGQVYLAGPNNEGIQSVIDDARALFGNAAVLGYRERNRVARATKSTVHQPAPSWAFEPGIAPATWHEFAATVAPHTWRIHSLCGVFSYDRVDAGTAFLLANLPAPRGLRVLDVGCGYGLIGLWAVAEGAEQVDMIDVNMLAVASAQRNIAGITNARALPGDALQPVADQRYDLVITNPPFHAGKSIDYVAAHAFIAHARAVLVPGGRLVLVANAFIPYAKLMTEVFENGTALANDRRYQVLVGR